MLRYYGGGKIKEEIYVWLSLIEELKLYNFLELMKVFHSSYNLYVSSNNENLLKEKLIQNNVCISKNLYYSLINKKIKEKSKIIYNNLKSKSIKIIPIYSKYYVKNLENMYNPPLALFVKGDLEILNYINLKKKLYIYNNVEFSRYGKEVYNKIYNYILTKDCINIDKSYNNLYKDSNSLITNILNLNIKRNKIISFIDINNNNNKNLSKKVSELIAGISDILIIPESSINIEIGIITDIFLELGKDILVVPGNIYNPSSYYSNSLIKEGLKY